MSISLRRLNAGLSAVALLLACGTATFAQAPVADGPSTSAPAGNLSTGPAIAGLRPVLDQVGSAVSNLRIERWKANGSFRRSTAGDADSIQRDLTATLPPLLNQAQAAAPGTVAPSFAVFRNVDALYDVLLRITEMATLAGSSAEASSLEDARAALESARAQLADSLTQSMAAQDAQLSHFRAQAAPAKTPAAVPTKIVVDDGPEHPKHRKPRPPTPQ